MRVYDAEKSNGFPRQPEEPLRGEKGRNRFRLLLPVCIIILFPAMSFEAAASSPATLNDQGNRRFAEGSYEEAEKLYREALTKDPGKPVIVYNLGNSLIRQGKYDQGIEALGRVIKTGNSRLQGKSWYNAGNALYAMGRFSEAAEAFIQALRLDPEDRDAMYNLELTLMRIADRHQDDSGGPFHRSEDTVPQLVKEYGDRQSPEQARSVVRQEFQPHDTTDHRAGEPDHRMSREEILLLLDAFQRREILQRQQRPGREAQPRTDRKDW
jgi:tetratricopeptide (TPR) repeat protein